MTDTNSNAAPRPPSEDYQFEGGVVAAGHGWNWIVEGFALFRKQPGAWILIAVVLGVLMVLLSLIPLLGSFATALLFPIFAGGLMLGCKELEQDGPLEIEHLFAGFRQKTGDLIMVGAFNLIGWVVITFATVDMIGSGAIMGAMRGGMPGAGIPIASTPISALLAAALSMPLYMATWFAPALIVLQNLSARAALKASFFACLRNWMPFLVYGLVLLVLCLVPAIPLGLGFVIYGAALLELGIAAAIVLLLGLLVLIPVLVASVYTAYRDIFCAGQEA